MTESRSFNASLSSKPAISLPFLIDKGSGTNKIWNPFWGFGVFQNTLYRCIVFASNSKIIMVWICPDEDLFTGQAFQNSQSFCSFVHYPNFVWIFKFVYSIES
jgi:hypothetical protein